jgi:uncharacterized membrane protein YphA (DoxX/SURF4 family)
MAFLSGCGEIGFPVLLVLGLGTRLAATGLLFMAFIAELTVPDGWPIHMTWAAMALAIMAWDRAGFQRIKSLANGGCQAHLPNGRFEPGGDQRC